ncbi:hypothetical protein L1987_79678 [Smallanthus sonchifolius]|uniref:Uncharacterized protein n=1 Tax=Smallanthus sonchifolius TaxID=185202 RepID=A0ACB8YJT1_9ASTR|nr:hypothetical protein L1987_79678 [Smallanthus sonchifolius]
MDNIVSTSGRMLQILVYHSYSLVWWANPFIKDGESPRVSMRTPYANPTSLIGIVWQTSLRIVSPRGCSLDTLGKSHIPNWDGGANLIEDDGSDVPRMLMANKTPP